MRLDNVELQVMKLDVDVTLPYYATEGAAAMDIEAAETVLISEGRWHGVKTGLAMAIPEGYEVQVRPRSGLALKHGISIMNTPGTIDSDYRGEIVVLIVNHSRLPYTVHKGDRIAQLVLSPVTKANIKHVHKLDETARGRGGFGSTGR